MKGHAGVLSNLLKPGRGDGCDPLQLNSEGMNCVHYAARSGDAEVLEALGPFLNAQVVNMPTANARPTTPLYFAVQAGSLESVRILAAAGAMGSKGRIDDGEEESAISRAKKALEIYATMLTELGETPEISSDRSSR